VSITEIYKEMTAVSRSFRIADFGNGKQAASVRTSFLSTINHIMVSIKPFLNSSHQAVLCARDSRSLKNQQANSSSQPAQLENFKLRLRQLVDAELAPLPDPARYPLNSKTSNTLFSVAAHLNLNSKSSANQLSNLSQNFLIALSRRPSSPDGWLR
jgi:hypothetical protein